MGVLEPEDFQYYRLNYGDFLPAAQNAKILDFGCGDGRFLDYCKRVFFKNAIGIDPNPHAASGRSNFEHVGDCAGYLRTHPDHFDFIMARQVVYYTPAKDLRMLFKAFHRALKPGGKLIIEVFNPALISGNLIPQKDLAIQVVVGEGMLRALANEAGLKIVTLKSEKLPKGGIKRALWRFARAAWTKALKVIYILERGQCPENPTLFGKNLILVAEKL